MFWTVMELTLSIVKLILLIYFALKMDKDYRENDTNSMIYHGFWIFLLIMQEVI